MQVESKFSDPEDLAEHGVPQGSILGPIIFIIINIDFPANSVEGESVLYADDDTGNVTDADAELKKKIQREATRSTDWVPDNRMVWSGDTTKLLIIGTSQLKKTKLPDTNEKVQIEVCGQTVVVTRAHSEQPSHLERAPLW